MNAPAPTAPLFTPFTLGGVTLPNRIALSPMGQHSAIDGTPTDWHLMHLGQFAVSGAGAVFTEATAIEPSGRISRGCLGLWSDEHARAFARISAFFAEYGSAKFGVQLYHSGRKGSMLKRWEARNFVPVDQGGWPIEGPSALPYHGRPDPLPFSRDRLGEVRDNFARAARLAHQGGFDLIELHAAHGYLLHQFLTPLANNRDDEYGGSLQNRMRFPLEVFDAVRDAFPAHKPVGVRVSCSDWADNGWTLEETLELTAALKARGCAYICASAGGTTPDQHIELSPGYQVPFAERIRRDIGIPTMAVGLIAEAEQANAIIANGQADLVALGRALLYDPRWPWHAADKLGVPLTYAPPYRGEYPNMRSTDRLKPGATKK